MIYSVTSCILNSSLSGFRLTVLSLYEVVVGLLRQQVSDYEPATCKLGHVLTSGNPGPSVIHS